ncbi:MAG: hypothetical protein JSS79_11310 [Bacteroidetes bacterium]|nr:hypothetical protein [Bacteroidota bacterium]
MSAFKNSSKKYIVYYTDTLDNINGPVAIWTRSIEKANDTFKFSWKWYQKDSLISETETIGSLKNLSPIQHISDWKKRGKAGYEFDKQHIRLQKPMWRTPKDSVGFDFGIPAYAFPMDLEIFQCFPFKKKGQKAYIAYYEPGRPSGRYYLLTVEDRTTLNVTTASSIDCWVLNIDYGNGNFAKFWISDKGRDMLKMREFFNGRVRYKILLY